MGYPPPPSPPPSPSAPSASSSPFLLLAFLLFLLSSSPLLLLLPSPPSFPLPPSLSDLSLLRRASLLPRHPASDRPPKLALLFLTNSNLPFSPLWDLFLPNSPLFNLYVHSDPYHPFPPPGGNFPASRFVPSRRTHRASPTLISAARRLLAHALLHDPHNQFFALLSQHCIPLHSFNYTYNALLRSPPGRSFIEILSSEPGLRDRYVARGDNVMMPEIPFDQFRVGSQFFILSRKHAMMVVNDQKLWKKFRLPCLQEYQYSCYPEEHYFPTLLSMEDPDGCSHYTLTRVNWTGSVDGHPHTYGPEEVSAELIVELRRSNSSYSYLFARKFAPESLGPLMQIANKVIFRN